MKKLISALIISSLFWITACHEKSLMHDASGIFETTEVVVSSESSGKVNELNLEEGRKVMANLAMGYIDTTQLYLKKLQLVVSRKASQTRMKNIPKQIAALKQQIVTQKREQVRFQNLVKSKAANQKQLDDIDAQLEVLEKQLAAQLEVLQNSNAGVNEESSSWDIQIAQTNDLIQKSIIRSPISGIILAKYTQPGEFASPGKPLFKVADIEHMFLRAYIPASLLSKVHLGQSVKVYADLGTADSKEYEGVVTWVSSQSEFTPKTIETRDERANQVYAVKIAVKNTEQTLKQGMYGEVSFQ